MIIRRRLVGIVLFCIGLGMLLVLTLPLGILFLALILTAAGFFLLCGSIRK